MACVTLHNVVKNYGSVPAVKPVSLKIEDQEFLVLVGPSGCGKTTILRLISGLEEVSAGDIFIDSKRINNIPPKDRDIAMVFQSYALYPHLNVYDNMAFGLKLRRVSKSEIAERVGGAARLLGLEKVLRRKPRELSGGERQRVAMGRAMVREPKVFLMDEPLSNLDAHLRSQMRLELQKLHRRLGITTLYVTHDQTEAMTLGTQIAVMNAGEIQQVGSPMEVYRRPASRFVAGFIGTMNFLEVGVSRDNGGISLKAPGFEIPVPKDKEAEIHELASPTLILGIRPEDIQLNSPESNLHGKVEALELLGSEAYLHISLGGASWTVKTDPGTQVRTGESAGLAVDFARLHAFDPVTGKAVVQRK